MFIRVLLMLVLTAKVFAATWEEPARGVLTTRLGVISPALQLEIKKADNTVQAPKLQYRPASASRTFFALSYANFGASGSTPNSRTLAEDLKYGTSTSTDFQFRFAGKKTSHEFYYQSYRGYYLENTSEVDSTYNDANPRLQIKDMTTEAAGINVIHCFQPELYHTSSIYDLSVRQKESGAGFLGIISLNKHRISSPSSLVLGSANGLYEGFEDFRSGSFYTLSGGLGAGGTLSLGGLYLGAMGIISLGYEKEYLEYVTEKRQFEGLTSRAYFRIGTGYNGKNFLFGIGLNVDNNTAPVAKTSVGFNTTESQVFVGYRWDGVNIRWLDRLSDFIFD